MQIRKIISRYGKYADIERASISLWHLIKSQFPGLSFEKDTAGKIILRQNDGTLLPLENLPAILYGKNAEIIVKEDGVYVGQKRILNFIAGSGIDLEIQQGSEPDTIDIVISTTGAGIGDNVYNEVPVGEINGSNTVFYTLYQFIDSSMRVYLNGLRLRQGSSYDYTTSGYDKRIVMNYAPLTGDSLVVDYVKMIE